MRRILASLALALLVASCSSTHTTSPEAAAAPEVLPPPNTPLNATRVFLYSWRRDRADLFRSVLTDNFRFEYAANDSAGNAFRERPFLREDLLASWNHLLVGGGPLPPARAVRVMFDPTLAVAPDPRPGEDPGWHKLVRTRLEAIVIEDWGGSVRERRVSGNALFYVVRGDSALIPPELVALGVRPDSTRWWVQRWDDETLPMELPPRSVPRVVRTSWGQLLADYL